MNPERKTPKIAGPIKKFTEWLNGKDIKEKKEQVHIRFEELKTKSRLVEYRTDEALQKVSKLDLDKKTTETIQALMAAVETKACLAKDVYWIAGLFSAGVSSDKIVKTWDLQEEEMRKLKDPDFPGKEIGDSPLKD